MLRVTVNLTVSGVFYLWGEREGDGVSYQRQQLAADSPYVWATSQPSDRPLVPHSRQCLFQQEGSFETEKARSQAPDCPKQRPNTQP